MNEARSKHAYRWMSCMTDLEIAANLFSSEPLLSSSNRALFADLIWTTMFVIQSFSIEIAITFLLSLALLKKYHLKGVSGPKILYCEKMIQAPYNKTSYIFFLNIFFHPMFLDFRNQNYASFCHNCEIQKNRTVASLNQNC